MITGDLTLSELTETAIRILSREIGPANTIRFLSQYRKGSGDYTRDRDEIFGNKTVEQLSAEIKAFQQSKKEKPDT